MQFECGPVGNHGGIAMYQTGDKVVYGSHGICCVVGQETRVIDKRNVIYLVLEPMGQGAARFYVPTHNQAAMGKLRRLLTRKELEDLLNSEKIRVDGWIRDENQRKQTYRELISSGDLAKLMQMVHTLYRHKNAQAAAGRKVHLCDENFLRDAEKLLASEAAIVLGMEYDQARKYLKENLN